MALGLPIEEQIKFFSDIFSGYRTTVAHLQKLSEDERDALMDRDNDDDNALANMLSDLETNYNETTPVPVLEYLFKGLLGVEEFHQSEIERLKKNKEEDVLGLDCDYNVNSIFEDGKEVIRIWKDKADYDVKQRIVDIGAQRNPEFLVWFYFQSYIEEAFEDEDAFDIPDPQGADEDDDEEEEDEDEEDEEDEGDEEDEEDEEDEDEEDEEEEENDEHEHKSGPPSKRPRLQ